MSDSILVHKDGGVLDIRLNRPEKKNALTQAMYQTLADTLNASNSDESIRSILLSAEGDTFCAGNDLEDFLKNPAVDSSSAVYQFMQAMVSAKKPIVASVHGQAVGIGTTMLLHCDLVYASNNTMFHLPFARLGVCPEFGASLLLPMMCGKQKASELMLCGEPFDASTAKDIGLLTAITAQDDVAKTALEKVTTLAQQPPLAMMTTKNLISEAMQPQLTDTIDREGQEFTRLLQQDEAKSIIGAFFKGKN